MDKKILFVDDEENWLSMVQTYLKTSAYEVVTAKDASEAMQKTEGIRLGLIILDVNLAGENGLVLMKFLRHNHPGVPIILYTAMQHDEQSVVSMLQMGASQYLRKGSMEELGGAVRRSFRR